MELKELNAELEQIGLRMIWDMDGKRVSIENFQFANPIIWFNAYEEEYNGTVQVKSINASEFTSEQIKKALQLVDDFLTTPLEKRKL